MRNTVFMTNFWVSEDIIYLFLFKLCQSLATWWNFCISIHILMIIAATLETQELKMNNKEDKLIDVKILKKLSFKILPWTIGIWQAEFTKSIFNVLHLIVYFRTPIFCTDYGIWQGISKYIGFNITLVPLKLW